MIHDEILHKWINKTISPEELRQFKQRPEYDELVELYERTDELQPRTFDTNEMLANILATDKKEVVVEKPEAKVVAFPNWAKLAIAAALIGLVALFFLPLNNNAAIEVATNTNETKNIDLPDGSKITLYDDSHIAYQGKDWQEKREVKLTGKATFDVEKGAPFTVVTDLGNVDVLGTIFTVDARNEGFSVECKEGEVRVLSANKVFKQEIAADESVLMKEKYMVMRTPNLMTIEDAALSDILNEMESEFEIKFDVKNIDLTEQTTVKLPRRNLNAALELAVGTMSDVSYEIQGKKVILDKK